MPLSVFQVLFKVNLFSRTFQDSPVYSSTFQACVNPADEVPHNVAFHQRLHGLQRINLLQAKFQFSSKTQ